MGNNEPVSIADEVPFDIPDSWEWVRLQSVCTKLVDGDHNPPKGEVHRTDYIMASSTNINQDRLVDLEKVRYLSAELFLRENERTAASEGDIFFTSVGSLGRSCIFDGSLNICFQRSVSVITTLLYNEYLKYCFDSGYFQNKVQKEATGTAQKGFYLNQLASALIPVPPYDEQVRIVSEIKKYLPLILEYENKQVSLNELNDNFPEQLKKSILQMAVQGKLVPQDPSDEPASVLLERIRAEKERLIKEGKIKRDKNESVIFRRDNSHYEKRDGVEVCIDGDIPYDIPDSWGWVRLNNICRIVNGFTPLRSNPDYWDNGTIPWFTVDDIHSQGRRIHKTAQKITSKALGKDSNRILPPQTVLLCCTASVGEYAISEIALTTNQQFNGLVINDVWKDIYDPEFLLILVQTFKDRLLTVAGKTTFNFVSVKKLGDLVVPVLSLQEQMRIIEAVNNALPIVDAL